MPNKFSKHSLEQLATCHPDLQKLAFLVLPHHDFRVEKGFRNMEEQNEAYRRGTSQLPWPKGRHNSFPSRAFDLIPYARWDGKLVALTDLEGEAAKDSAAKFGFFLGIVQGIAVSERLDITFGVDWDRDGEIVTDQSFDDWFHIELYDGPSATSTP